MWFNFVCQTCALPKIICNISHLRKYCSKSQEFNSTLIKNFRKNSRIIWDGATGGDKWEALETNGPLLIHGACQAVILQSRASSGYSHSFEGLGCSPSMPSSLSPSPLTPSGVQSHTYALSFMINLQPSEPCKMLHLNIIHFKVFSVKTYQVSLASVVNQTTISHKFYYLQLDESMYDNRTSAFWRRNMLRAQRRSLESVGMVEHPRQPHVGLCACLTHLHMKESFPRLHVPGSLMGLFLDLDGFSLMA